MYTTSAVTSKLYSVYQWAFSFFPLARNKPISASLFLSHTLDSGQGIVTEEGLVHPCVNSHHSVPVVSHKHTHTYRTIHVQAYIRTQTGRGEKVRKKAGLAARTSGGQIHPCTYNELWFADSWLYGCKQEVRDAEGNRTSCKNTY